MSENSCTGYVTIVSKDFTAAALEFHRRRMGENGYIVDGPIVRHQFFLLDGHRASTSLFDGEAYFAVTFRRRDVEPNG